MKFFNAPYNIYSTIKFDYKERMTQTYGFCRNESWGFYNKVIEKFNLKKQKIQIINNDFVLIHNLFNEIDITNEKNPKLLMILNFQSKNDETIYSYKLDNINKYSIKYRFNNCYLLELND
jgi:hypothetical protein|tara:strand:+ start:279 stop:638 length:360 start_codon:yes stop_codon:yes gene_type:complete